MKREVILSVENLRKYFPVESGTVKAVDGVSLDIYKGETLGLVGESGCGKSTLVRSILRLTEPTSGSIKYRDKDIINLPQQDMVRLRKDLSIVFQDPHSSLNPRMTVFDILARPLKIHRLAANKQEITLKIIDTLKTMGLQAEHMIRFPHEMSGGQKQRVGIARAMAMEPEIIFLDEPTSALDVSVQTKILKLLAKAKEEYNLTYVFITHDINLIRVISDRIAVMYLGKIVEVGGVSTIFHKPKHPYTIGLFLSVPQPDPGEKIIQLPLEGEVPSPVNPPRGCNFHPRCRDVMDICRAEEPALIHLEDGRRVACHRFAR